MLSSLGEGKKGRKEREGKGQVWATRRWYGQGNLPALLSMGRYISSLAPRPEAPLSGFPSRPVTYLMSKCTISLWWR